MTTNQKNNYLRRWSKIGIGVSVALLIFLLPSNLFLKFGESSAFVHGLQVDYLIPKLFLSDIVIFLLFFWWVCERTFTPKKFALAQLSPELIALGLSTVTIILLQLLDQKIWAGMWYTAKLIEMGVLFFVLVDLHKRNLFPRRLSQLSVNTMLLFQSLLGICQWFTQRHLFPSYLFLGESRLTSSIGLAQTTIDGVQKILPYGTTAHPNILAGVLLVGIIFLFISWRQKKPALWLSVIMLLSIFAGGLTLYLTQSWSAWLCLITAGILALTPKNFFSSPKKLLFGFAVIGLCIYVFAPLSVQSLATLFPNSQSFQRRAYLQVAAVKMWQAHPFWGVGLNQFTVHVEQYSQSREVVRFVQPVHQIGWLWLAETGILGLAYICAIIYLTAKNLQFGRTVLKTLFFLLPILCLDHYLLTSQTGMLIAVAVIIFFFFNLDKSESKKLR